MTEFYVIESLEGERGTPMRVWLKSERFGYTTSLDEAGRYTKEEAEHICALANASGVMNEKAWREADIYEGHAGRVVKGVLASPE